MNMQEGSGRHAALEASPAPSALKISFFEFVSLIAMMMALTATSIDIMLPSLPEIGAALNVANENDQQYVIVMYFAGFAIGQLIYGPLSDRIGRKPALFAGMAIFLAASFAAVSAPTFELLLLARAAQGLGAASPRVVALAIVRDLYVGRDMARVMSFAMIIFIIVPVIAPSLGQGLAHLGNWRWTFYALIAMGLIITVWAWLRLQETARLSGPGYERLPFGAAAEAVLRNAQTVGYGLAGGFMFGCLLAYVATSQQIFAHVYDMKDAFPIIFGAVASVMALASFTNAKLVGRYGMRRVSHLALTGYLTISIVLTVLSYAGLASFIVFAICVSGALFLFSLMAPNFNALAMEPQGHNAGMASSLIGASSTAIAAVVAGVIGHYFDGSVLPVALGFVGSSALTLATIYVVEGRAGMYGRTRPVLS